MFIVMCAMGGGFYLYYQDSQAKIMQLTENNAKLETAVATSEAAISSLQESYLAAQLENERLNAAYTEIRRQNNVLADKLSDIDLGLLASQKPDSIERAVNNGTSNAGRCFEILSGAELTEEELNATSGEDFNKECPWLWIDPATRGLSGQ